MSIEALDILNDMMYALENDSVNMRLNDYRAAEFTLTDTWYFWVPPADLSQTSVDKWQYQGTWDADANSPALTNASGTDGYVYRVSVAGTTELNSINDWAVNDFLMFGAPLSDVTAPYAVFDRNWYRSERTRKYDDALSAMLALRLSEELGHEINPHLVKMAERGRNALHNAFAKPKDRNLYDTGIVYTPTWARFNTDEAI